MILKNLKIKDFCNYKNLSLEFSPGDNAFFGDNAAGKTNLLEAIYFLAFLRSQRGCMDEELIRWGGQDFYLSGEVERKESFIHKVEVFFDKDGGKKLRINSKVRTRLPPAEEGLKIVGFYPDDLLLIGGAPSGRRRFLNLEISQIDGTYRSYLRQYQGIVAQRNLALRRVRARKGLPDDLFPWDEQAAKIGARIIEKRASTIAEIYAIGNKIHRFLTAGKEELTVRYVSSVDGGQPVAGKGEPDHIQSCPEVVDNFRKTLSRLREKEISMGMTLAGPHRDDIRFFINDVDASIFSSHAQRRTIAVSLRLAWAEFLEQILGEPPVILLDDVLSELDGKRRAMLLDFVQSHKMQCFITGVSAELFKNNLKQATFFEVNDGTINRTA
jgi:DNA replication and repair protein RecF